MQRYQLGKLAENINTIIHKWGICRCLLQQILTHFHHHLSKQVDALKGAK
jgi:hypothetical protein